MSVISESKVREGEEDEEETSIGIGISSNNTARTENTTMSSPRRDRTTAPSTPAKKGCENISLFRAFFSPFNEKNTSTLLSLSLSWFCAFESTLKRGWNVRDDAFAQSGAFGFTSAARQSRAVLSWNCALARAVSWDTVLYAEWLFSIRRFFYITTGKNDKAKVKTKPTVSSIRHDVLLHKFKLFDHDLRYGPTAGLTRRERLELAIANKI